MAGNKTNIDRLKELDKLLKRLRKTDTNDNSDIDLILSYLEKFLVKPGEVSKGSKKLIEFEIKDDFDSLFKIYKISWRRTALEETSYGNR